MKITLPILCALLLWSCDTPRNYDPESPYYRFPANSRLILNQPLEIPGGWATARLQFGKVVPFGSVREYEPHCIFEINTVSPEAQHVETDIFSIIRVQRDVREIAAMSSPFVHTAFGVGVGGRGQMFYKTIFTLKSERQPGVLRLTCQSDQYAAGIGIPNHLSVPEIRQALGDIFTLELPGSPP